MSEERTQYETGDVVDASELPAMLKRGNKYHAVKTWSELCQREFDSKAEAIRGEELWLMQEAEQIFDLQFQPSWTASEKHPKLTYTADFLYWTQPEDGAMGFHPPGTRVVEDIKGVFTRTFRWQWWWMQTYEFVNVRILTRKGDGWTERTL